MASGPPRPAIVGRYWAILNRPTQLSGLIVRTKCGQATKGGTDMYKIYDSKEGFSVVIHC